MSVTDRAEGWSELPGVPDLPLPQDYQSYRWGWAPQGLATVRQLRAMGLRPARRNEPVSDITWRRGDRVAYLHRVDEAVPVQPPTAQQSAALAAAMRARKTCSDCGREEEYVLPTRFTGSPQCLDCHEMTSRYEERSAGMSDHEPSQGQGPEQSPVEVDPRERARAVLNDTLGRHQGWREEVAMSHPAVQGGLDAETAALESISAAAVEDRWRAAVDAVRGRFGQAAADALEQGAAGEAYDEFGVGFYGVGQAAQLMAGLGFDTARIEAALGARLDDYGQIRCDELASGLQELVDGVPPVDGRAESVRQAGGVSAGQSGLGSSGAEMSVAQSGGPYVRDPLNPTDAELQAAIERGIAEGSILAGDDALRALDAALHCHESQESQGVHVDQIDRAARVRAAEEAALNDDVDDLTA